MTLTVEWSTPCDLLSAALVAALAEMPSIPKANKADLGSHKYSYADLGDGVDLVRPILAQHALGVTQAPITTEHGVTVVTTILHSSGQRVSAALAMKPGANTPQAVGSAITYARRYSLFSILGLATEDDDGKAASAPAPPARPERLSPQRIEAFKIACHDNAVDEEGMYEIVAAATEGRTRNPGMVHEDEHRALQAAFKKWLADHPDPLPLPTEGTEP